MRPQSLPEGDAVEESQGTAGLVVGAAGDVSLLDEVEQVGADVLGAEELGRLAEVAGEAATQLT